MSDRWYHSAACTGMDTEVFFDDSAAGLAAARRVCAGCPVRQECLSDGARLEDAWGVWGGRSRRQRRSVGVRPRRPSLRPLAGMCKANAEKTRCKEGHPFDSENTAFYRGSRICVTCHLDRNLRARKTEHSR